MINSTVVIRERFKPPPSSIEAALRFQSAEGPGDVFQIQFVVAKNTHSTPHYLQCTLLHWRAGRSLICRVPCPLREVSLFRGLAGSAEPRCAIIFFRQPALELNETSGVPRPKRAAAALLSLHPSTMSTSADSNFQTDAMTSCCSVANLTLLSGAPSGADGKRAWSLVRGDGRGEEVRWTSWSAVLKDAGCSAGGEGQDARSATPGLLNWYNKSVCSARA